MRHHSPSRLRDRQRGRSYIGHTASMERRSFWQGTSTPKADEPWKDAHINKAGRQLCSEAHPFPDQSLQLLKQQKIKGKIRQHREEKCLPWAIESSDQLLWQNGVSSQPSFFMECRKGIEICTGSWLRTQASKSSCSLGFLLCHLLAVCEWVGGQTSLCLHFLTCKMNLIVPAS